LLRRNAPGKKVASKYFSSGKTYPTAIEIPESGDLVFRSDSGDYQIPAFAGISTASEYPSVSAIRISGTPMLAMTKPLWERGRASAIGLLAAGSGRLPTA
jgi:hypothetical protein